MTVTKQQQLEWLSKTHEEWPYIGPVMIMSDKSIGAYYGAPMPGCHFVSLTEWQQERDKMQKQAEQAAQPAPDNSWHERGELPPVGVPVELWWGGSFAYNCEFITRRGHHYVMWNLDADIPDASDYMNSEFRPLRTERDKAIDEMIGILKAKFDRSGIDGITVADIVDELYDAGYRKINP